jgi:hypothetical protein
MDWLETFDFEQPRLNARGVKGTASLDVPKENIAVRRAVVLDRLDRLIYQALVDRLSVGLIGSLPSWVYGWRLSVRKPNAGEWARNDEQWRGFRQHLKALALYDSARAHDGHRLFFLRRFRQKLFWSRLSRLGTMLRQRGSQTWCVRGIAVQDGAAAEVRRVGRARPPIPAVSMFVVDRGLVS